MPAPKLDDRSVTDIVKQCQDLAALYTPSWAGATRPGDPGHEMLRLFGRLMELLIGRFNQVPDKNFLSFLEMVGVERFAGAMARAPVTFVPSKKAAEGGEVPARTQVATTQTEKADAQIFETLESFHVTPAKLLMVVNVVPDSDGYSLSNVPETPPSIEFLTDVASASTLLSPTASTLRPFDHTLYLGSEKLFGRDEPVDITITIHATAGGNLFSDSNLVFKRYSSDSEEWIPIAGTAPSAPPSVGDIALVLPGLAGVEASEVEGIEDFWIAVEFVGDLSASSVPPEIDSAVGTIAPAAASPASIQATAGFYNSTKLDLSKPFLPFGERPRYGDAFYVGSDIAFSSDISDVTLQFQIRNYTNSELQDIFANIPSNVELETIVVWQYLAVDGTWKTLDVTNPAIFERAQTIQAGAMIVIGTPTVTRNGTSVTAEDGTLFGFGSNTTQFKVALGGDMGKGEVGGVESFWIRGLITSEDPYGEEGYVVTVPGSPPPPPPPPLPVVVGPSFIPPVVEALTLDYSHRSDSHVVDRLVVANNRLSESVQLTVGTGVPVFLSPEVQRIDGVDFFGPDAALYLAFDRPFGNRYTAMFFLLEEASATVSSPLETGDPQIAWEYLDLDGQWRSLDVDDKTVNLTTSGTVSFLAPAETLPLRAIPLLFGEAERETPNYWYRARLAGGSYDYPPQLLGVFLNTMLAENGVTVDKHEAGSGNGEPSQKLTLVRKPILAGELWIREPEVPAEPELLELEQEHLEAARRRGDLQTRSISTVDSQPLADGEFEHWVRWLRVPNFLSSKPRSRHYSLDAVNGTLQFGDGERGLIPPLGKDNLVVRGLVSGGGELANTVASTLAIKELKSSLPFVDKVFNVVGAVGGADYWTLESTMKFGPQVVKNRRRAVSTEDYEWMVRERFSEVGRAICLPTTRPLPLGGLGFRAGAITMVVVPKSSQRLPRPSNGLLRAVEEFLERKVLGTIVSEVHAVGPDFKTVEIHATVAPDNPRQGARVARRVGEALEAFFHPLTGGERGDGWTFGRSVHISKIHAVIERTQGVDFVHEASFAIDPQATSLSVNPNSLVASGLHHIEAL